MANGLLKSVNLVSPISRKYMNLTGVDFMNESSRVALNRSPDALNVYKDYTKSGECIQTRAGHMLLAELEHQINGIYFYEFGEEIIAIVHSGECLYKWNNYTRSVLGDFELLFDKMNNSKSIFLVFNDVLFILDGKNYLFFDGTVVKNVSDIAYIPTTTIGREPSGGGEIYQSVNVLQPKRKNQFIADGKATSFALDAVNIGEDEVKAIINDNILTENKDFTVDREKGIVSFNTAPTAPTLSGRDNVYIEFSKRIEGYLERILNCTIAQVFDNRIFFSGNPNYPNAIFHCKLEEPGYISDLDYYQDGLDDSRVKSMCVGNNLLWVFKESNQQNNTIFYHTPMLDSVNGKIYPSSQGNISIGCYSDSINFNDDIVFMTKYGLEGVSGNISSEQVLSHRSSMVDAKMTNENEFNKCSLTEWQGYLLCLVNGKIFLADSRQVFRGISGNEYEWYFWDGFSTENSKLVLLREYDGNLYLGFSDGKIAILAGTNDNRRVINSYWTTPYDLFGSENHYKTINKRGAVVKLKTVNNSKVKVASRTNKDLGYKFVKEYAMSGFDYSNIDYLNWVYSSPNQDYLVVRVKEKKIISLSTKVYSDELDRPFGLYGLTIEAYLGGYVKR